MVPHIKTEKIGSNTQHCKTIFHAGNIKSEFKEPDEVVHFDDKHIRNTFQRRLNGVSRKLWKLRSLTGVQFSCAITCPDIKTDEHRFPYKSVEMTSGFRVDDLFNNYIVKNAMEGKHLTVTRGQTNKFFEDDVHIKNLTIPKTQTEELEGSTAPSEINYTISSNALGKEKQRRMRKRKSDKKADKKADKKG
jgi:hypothetical protein